MFKIISRKKTHKKDFDDSGYLFFKGFLLEYENISACSSFSFGDILHFYHALYLADAFPSSIGFLVVAS